MAGSQNHGLSIFQWNCNGLHLANSKYTYDVICSQETFLKPGKNFSLTGYNTVRKDRIGMGKGGLITLVKDSLIYTETDSHNDTECILVEIKTDNKLHNSCKSIYFSRSNLSIQIN